MPQLDFSIFFDEAFTSFFFFLFFYLIIALIIIPGYVRTKVLYAFLYHKLFVCKSLRMFNILLKDKRNLPISKKE